MERPRVVTHNAISVDGRLDGFSPDLARYYQLAGTFPQQAILSGSGTVLAAATSRGVEMVGEDPARSGGDVRTEEASLPGARAEEASLPLMVIVDSQGRLTRLDWLRSRPHWHDVLILCSSATPAAHLDRLDRSGTPYEVVGDEHVDLVAALDVLGHRYGVRHVRVDAGPGLNGALLRAGLVDEVSILLAPYLVGHRSPQPLHLFDGLASEARRLQLISVEQLPDDHVWLRYVVRPAVDLVAAG
ncbi:MAG TPA: RibD family protein [Nitriliruptorales bacterium]|nr:RibD family protein [Nitriliruptorales bacterium]